MTTLPIKNIRIQYQFKIFVEKYILYAKITLSQKNFVSKLRFKQTAAFHLRSSNNVTDAD